MIFYNVNRNLLNNITISLLNIIYILIIFKINNLFKDKIIINIYVNC